MNPAAQTLQLLLERAEEERDAAQARALQAAEMARRLARQAEQLLVYRDEYRRRSPALAVRGTTMELLRYHRDFMQRLEQAIALQRQQLEATEREAAALRETLLAHETRVASVRKLIERRLKELNQRVARIEQRHSDEAATRAAWTSRRTLTTY
jgi:flagellar FliJ protein